MLSNLIVILLIVGAASLFYWNVAQPVLLRPHVYRLSSLRDSLRWEMIEGRLDIDDKNAATLSRIIEAITANAQTMSILHFFWFRFVNRNREMPDNIKRYCRDAPDTIKKLNRIAMETSIAIMLINAPVFSVIFSTALLRKRLKALGTADDFVVLFNNPGVV